MRKTIGPQKLLHAGNDKVVEEDRFAGIRHGAGAGAFADEWLSIGEGDGGIGRLLRAFGPNFSGDDDFGRIGLLDLKLEEGPFAGGPFKGHGSFESVAAIEFEFFLRGGDAEFVAAETAEADIKDGVAAAFGFGEDAGLNGDVGVFFGAEKETVSLERRAGEFDELIAGVLFLGEQAVNVHELVREGAEFGFLEVVLIKHFGMKRGGE